MNAILEQNYTLELLIALEMAYSCCLGLRGNLDFPDLFQKSFITSTTDNFSCKRCTNRLILGYGFFEKL